MLAPRRSIRAIRAIPACAALAVSLATACSTFGSAASDSGDAGDAGPRTDTAMDGGESPYASAVLEDAPVAYWRFDDPMTPTARDSSGHGNDGVYHDGVTLPVDGAILGDPNSAVGLDDGFITVGPPFAWVGQSGTFSLEAWVKPAAGAAAAMGIAGQFMLGPFAGVDLSLGNSSPCDGGSCRELNFVTSGEPTIGGAIVAVGAWSHVVATFDGDTLRLYVNGKGEVALQRAPALPIPAGSPFSLGEWANGGLFVGALDEAAVYDHALSEARVLAHYHASGR